MAGNQTAGIAVSVPETPTAAPDPTPQPDNLLAPQPSAKLPGEAYRAHPDDLLSIPNDEEMEQKVRREQAENHDNRDTPDIWYWGDGTRGEGPRPEFLSHKYKNVAEQAKAYTELEKKFGGFTGAPPEYDFESIKKTGYAPDLENPVGKEFMEYAKQANMSQKHVESLMAMMHKYESQRLPPSREDIYRDLGPTATDTLRTVGNWTNNNFTADEMPLLNNIARMGAPYVKVLEKMRQLATSSASRINTTDMANTNAPKPATKAEVQARYLQDPKKYNAQINPENYRKWREDLENALD